MPDLRLVSSVVAGVVFSFASIVPVKAGDVPKPTVTVNAPRPTINIAKPTISVQRPNVVVPHNNISHPQTVSGSPKVDKAGDHASVGTKPDGKTPERSTDAKNGSVQQANKQPKEKPIAATAYDLKASNGVSRVSSQKAAAKDAAAKVNSNGTPELPAGATSAPPGYKDPNHPGGDPVLGYKQNSDGTLTVFVTHSGKMDSYPDQNPSWWPGLMASKSQTPAATPTPKTPATSGGAAASPDPCAHTTCYGSKEGVTYGDLAKSDIDKEKSSIFQDIQKDIEKQKGADDQGTRTARGGLMYNDTGGGGMGVGGGGGGNSTWGTGWGPAKGLLDQLPQTDPAQQNATQKAVGEITADHMRREREQNQKEEQRQREELQNSPKPGSAYQPAPGLWRMDPPL